MNENAFRRKQSVGWKERVMNISSGWGTVCCGGDSLLVVVD